MGDYNLDDHGKTDRSLYDQYVEEKFPSLEGKTVAITGTSVNGMVRRIFLANGISPS